jgi:hypothetical protein
MLEAGWEWVKPDPYDDAYYREHMHELPPLIHKARDRMIDVHHTILPRTHRVTPDPLVLMAEAVQTSSGFACSVRRPWSATAPPTCWPTATFRALAQPVGFPSAGDRIHRQGYRFSGAAF